MVICIFSSANVDLLYECINIFFVSKVFQYLSYCTRL